MQYNLSISIPTYNRAEYLPELLDSILLQPRGDEIEIAISDNASTDNTEELIKKYQTKYKNINYIKMPENLGADKNYFNAVSISSGNYIWLMGSDDKLADNALELVLKEIESGKDIYLQDRIECDINMNILNRRSWWKSDIKRNWDFNQDDICEYFDKCLSLGGVFSYLSSIVFRKKAWDSYKNIPEKYFGTAYSHVYTLTLILKNKGTLQLIRNSGVCCRGGNDHFALEGMKKRVAIDFYGYNFLSKDLELPCILSPLNHERSYKEISFLFLGYNDAKEKYNLLRSCRIPIIKIMASLFFSFARVITGRK